MRNIANTGTGDELTSGNILKTSVVMGRIPLVSTSYLSLVPAGVFLLVVNRKEGALQQRDRDILWENTEERMELVFFCKWLNASINIKTASPLC